LHQGSSEATAIRYLRTAPGPAGAESRHQQDTRSKACGLTAIGLPMRCRGGDTTTAYRDGNTPYTCAHRRHMHPFYTPPRLLYLVSGGAISPCNPQTPSTARSAGLVPTASHAGPPALHLSDRPPASSSRCWHLEICHGLAFGLNLCFEPLDLCFHVGKESIDFRLVAGDHCIRPLHHTSRQHTLHTRPPPPPPPQTRVTLAGVSP
jgi:hypothetical protein